MARRILASAVLLVVLVPAAHASPDIALIGDDYLGVVLRGVAAEEGVIRERDGVYELAVESAGVTVRSPVPGSGVTALANLLLASDIVLIVVDSTRGPTPVIREQVIVARQARVPMLAVLLANVSSLAAGAPDEAAEILALEARELRELAAAYEMNGNAVKVYLDARPPGAVAGVAGYGSRASLQSLARFVPRRVRSVDVGPVRRIWGAIYLLTDEEAGGSGVELSPNDSIVLWSEGTASDATLESRSVYYPGDVREMPLRMEAPVDGVEGSRILLMSGDRVVGLGAITQVVE